MTETQNYTHTIHECGGVYPLIVSLDDDHVLTCGVFQTHDDALMAKLVLERFIDVFDEFLATGKLPAPVSVKHVVKAVEDFQTLTTTEPGEGTH